MCRHSFLGEYSKPHGYRKFTFLLRRDYKLIVNHKRVHRVYRTLDLKFPKRRPKHSITLRGRACLPATRPNERWSVDFVKDRLVGGRQIRELNVVDDFTCECMRIEIDF